MICFWKQKKPGQGLDKCTEWRLATIRWRQEGTHEETRPGRNQRTGAGHRHPVRPKDETSLVPRMGLLQGLNKGKAKNRWIEEFPCWQPRTDRNEKDGLVLGWMGFLILPDDWGNHQVTRERYPPIPQHESLSEQTTQIKYNTKSIFFKSWYENPPDTFGKIPISLAGRVSEIG